MTEPKDKVQRDGFKGFTNTACPFFPCHTGVINPEENFNCMFCYCPLVFLKCPGPYEVFEDAYGVKRKDCSACNLPHVGYDRSWKFIQRWLVEPETWDGEPQDTRRLKAQAFVENPREGSEYPQANTTLDQMEDYYES